MPGRCETGSHVNSMIAVRDGLADVCAIDAICVAMARRYRPDYLEGLVKLPARHLFPAFPMSRAVAALKPCGKGWLPPLRMTELKSVASNSS